MTLNIDNTRIMALVANVIPSVGAERRLCDKLSPWIESARLWLESNMLGTTFQPEGELLAFVEKIIVYKALADAVPSLDLSLTPAGFAVISTEGRAPASKERVERLIASLRSSVDANLVPLCSMLMRIEEWRAEAGAWWADSFIPDLDDVSRFRRELSADMFTTYRAMRDIAVRLELSLAENYLGHAFLSFLKQASPAFEEQGTREIHSMIRLAMVRHIDSRLVRGIGEGQRRQELWHIARPIISALGRYPALKEKWDSEMAGVIEVRPFTNKVRGGYFF